jgi:hypothetical protein
MEVIATVAAQCQRLRWLTKRIYLDGSSLDLMYNVVGIGLEEIR